MVTVREAVCCEPTVTLPKLSVAGLLASCPASTPVPESGIASVGFGAFEVSVTLPLAAPAVCGANVTLKVVLCPAATVAGVVIPLRVNPVPVIAACEIVTLVPPVLVTVSEAVCCEPTVTLPKSSLDGLLASDPAAIPVPERATFVAASEALLFIVAVALTGPAAFGLKATLTVTLCPAATVVGRLGAVSENELSEMLTLLTVTD